MTYPYLHYIYGPNKEAVLNAIKAVPVKIIIKNMVNSIADVARDAITSIFDFSNLNKTNNAHHKYLRLEYLYHWFFLLDAKLKRHCSALSFASGESPLPPPANLGGEKQSSHLNPSNNESLEDMTNGMGAITF